MDHHLPFAHLNLRRNPFGQLSLAETARLATVDLRAVLPRFSDPRFVLQLVGEKGYGKTTHALAIVRHFPGAAYVHIGEGERATVPTGELIVIDEAQRLHWWQVHQLFRRPVPLVLGTHYDFNQWLRLYRRRVETIRVGQRMTAAWLRAVLNRRIQAARRGPGRLPHVQLATAASLLEEHGPNLRAIQEALYLRFQELREIQNV